MDDQRKRDLAAGWWRDSWGEWHGPVRDLGNSGPREPSGPQVPPHLRPAIPAIPAPFVAAFDPDTAPDTSPTASEPPDPVITAPSASDEAGRALRGLMDFLRALLPDEEPKP